MIKLPRVLGWVLSCVLAGALVGCGGDGERRLPGELLYSPNGEPIGGGALGPADCEAATGRWLARVDRDGDGMIDRAEFIADARRQFAAMDLDHDGFVTPPELQQYRARFAREEQPRPAATGEPGGERPGRRRVAGEAGREPVDRIDPVMSADLSLRNKVSEADFLAQAERRFRAIDSDHDGRLDKYELVKACSVGRS
ncbi:MAG: hypothetical protein JWL84_647 [Rhodospirillales bacterium]|jgi:Ca2+-binding EF-hand superfamily protein|nr:hypothetical protein [Rhodospirillales bacterium]